VHPHHGLKVWSVHSMDVSLANAVRCFRLNCFYSGLTSTTFGVGPLTVYLMKGRTTSRGFIAYWGFGAN
jgi:hypothetical protein